ncbi:ATP-binding protein [Nocardia sp. R6R-6]|uniref:ATP-binding protein n=1 Tax=Nocardia sp. R6R-6 TaxID=3459303 RepID=UPI00403E15EE
MITRWPIRVRLTLAFAALMAVVLGGVGIATVAQTREALDESAAVSPQIRDNMITDLRGELAIALPLVWLAATVGAFTLATATLRPVERMRRRAAEITITDTRPSLPVPHSRDEIARLGTTFNDLLARLHEALQREREFVADAGHELRTPLAMLTTELELALHAPRSNDELRAALTAALSDTNRLARLAQDLLLLARDNSEPLIVVAVDKLLTDVIGRYRNGDITLTVPAQVFVRADPSQLERAIGNLIDNAVDHGRPPIIVQAAELDGLVTITVRDHGPGFPPQFLARAFDRFTRADTARTSGGTGLGLAIAAAVIGRHHGTIRATNHPDGAELTLTLPAARR